MSPLASGLSNCLQLPIQVLVNRGEDYGVGQNLKQM